MREGRRLFEVSSWKSGVFSLHRSHFKLLMSSVAVLLLPALLAGCRNRDLDQAQQELREAKAKINTLNFNLEMQAKEIALGKAELAVVRQDRDVLQKMKDQLIAERDQASSSAQQAQEAVTRLTTQATGQGSMTNALQKQVAELKTLVDEQQKLIELLKSGGGQPGTPPAQPADKPATPDPNAKP